MPEKTIAAEIYEEARELVFGRVPVADGVLPPLVFVAVNAVWGVVPGAIAGIGSALAIVAWRLFRGRPLRFALAGLAGTSLAVALALRSGSARDYFVPGLLSGAGTTVLILASIAWRRPLVAWTSWLTRGWPIDWYWHPQVRPAYSRASWLWAGFFTIRTSTQGWLYMSGEEAALGLVRVITGWPGLLALLAVTYYLGRRWLDSLEGPSVVEFEEGSAPPWSGQQRGF